MKRRLQNCLVLLLVLVFTIFPSHPVLAIPGVPGSADFGSGVVIYPFRPDSQEALIFAEELDVDWIDLPVRWSQVQTNPGQSLDVSTIDQFVQAAESNGIGLMLTISDPPDWALTPDGPDPELTAAFASLLAQRYTAAVQAIELFPGANTHHAWMGQVSAKAYFQVFQAAAEELHRVNPSLVLVAAGLQPLPEIPLEGDIQDLVFLEDLYALGAASWMPVLSLQYPELTGEPMLLSSPQEDRVLRHYEEVRKIMVENQHFSGTIWITQITLPSGTIDIRDLQYLNNGDAQVAWLAQAFDLMRAQLFIGVAFLPSLNSNGEGTAAQVLSLNRGFGNSHPFHAVLRKIAGGTQESSLENRPGKHKDGSLEKKRPWL